MLYNLTRNPENIIGMAVNTRDDFQLVQRWCDDHGIACYMNSGFNNDWNAQVYEMNGKMQNIQPGDWAVIINGTRISIFSPEAGAELFTVGDPVT